MYFTFLSRPRGDENRNPFDSYKHVLARTGRGGRLMKEGKMFSKDIRYYPKWFGNVLNI